MHATVSKEELALLIEARLGELFVAEDPRCSEAVLTLSVEVDVIPETPDLVRILGEHLARRLHTGDPRLTSLVTVVACRVKIGEPGYLPTGATFRLRGDTPIVKLEQVEPLALRAAEKPETPPSRTVAQMTEQIVREASPHAGESSDDLIRKVAAVVGDIAECNASLQYLLFGRQAEGKVLYVRAAR